MIKMKSPFFVHCFWSISIIYLMLVVVNTIAGDNLKTGENINKESHSNYILTPLETEMKAKKNKYKIPNIEGLKFNDVVASGLFESMLGHGIKILLEAAPAPSDTNIKKEAQKIGTYITTVEPKEIETGDVVIIRLHNESVAN